MKLRAGLGPWEPSSEWGGSETPRHPRQRGPPGNGMLLIFFQLRGIQKMGRAPKMLFSNRFPRTLPRDQGSMVQS